MLRSLLIWFLCIGSVLPSFGSPGPLGDEERPRLLPPSVPIPLDGLSVAASFYRPAFPGSEGVVVFTGTDPSLWNGIIDSLLDRGVSVLALPPFVPAPSAASAFRWLEAELGEDAIVGLGAENRAVPSAWQLARLAEPGATLLIDARTELPTPEYLFASGSHDSVLLLALEDDFVARERARSLFVSAPGRVELWLLDGEGMAWPELLARRDIASDLAHWWLRSLEAARAARATPVADGTEAR